MLEKLVEMDHKITNDDWKQSDIQEFMDKWGSILFMPIWPLMLIRKNRNLTRLSSG